MNDDRDPEHRPSSIGFPIVQLFPYYFLLPPLYLTQRESKDLEMLRCQPGKNLLFMTRSAPWPCEHVIWERTGGRKRKLARDWLIELGEQKSHY